MNKELNEKILLSLLDCFWSTGLASHEALVISCQILAWAKLSQHKNIPSNLSLNDSNAPSDIAALNDIFSQISELENLGENRKAFRWFLPSSNNIKIAEAIKIALQLKQNNLVDNFDIHSHLLENSSKYGRGFYPITPIEVIKLMVNLAGDIKGKSAYCPWDCLAEFASVATLIGAKASIESVNNTVFPWLVNIFKGTDIEILIGNPIWQPGFQSKGELTKFDMSIAFPPFNQKYDLKVHNGDWFDRFSEKTSSGNVLHIRHIVAQTKGKAIIAVSNNVLFSSGAEQVLRRKLLDQKQIEAVISLPPALLSQTQIPFSIIVIDVQGKSDRVSFVNGNDERFFAKDGKGRSRLVNWKNLLDTLRAGEDESCIVRVPVERIIENNSYLEVSAYTLPPEKKKIDRILNDSKTVSLNSLVNFVRPPVKQRIGENVDPEQEIEAVEVTMGDFPEYGYVQNPTRIVSLEKYNKTETNYLLERGDILIAVKASTGKVAIVANVADAEEERPWIANQSCLILRSKGKIDPKVLFMYLSSAMGQYLLRSLSSGATIPIIQLARLKELPVVIPSTEEVAKIMRDFDRMVELQSQIEGIKQEQQQLGDSYWSL
jgi:type I restriction enzyme M protein